MTESCGEQPTLTPPPYSDNLDSVEVMQFIDRLKPDMRALIHDFGFVIVRDMYNDGHRNAVRLREELDAWRERKQEQWLSEVPYRAMRSGLRALAGVAMTDGG